jgi:hypothetical protein
MRPPIEIGGLFYGTFGSSFWWLFLPKFNRVHQNRGGALYKRKRGAKREKICMKANPG